MSDNINLNTNQQKDDKTYQLCEPNLDILYIHDFYRKTALLGGRNFLFGDGPISSVKQVPQSWYPVYQITWGTFLSLTRRIQDTGNIGSILEKILPLLGKSYIPIHNREEIDKFTHLLENKGKSKSEALSLLKYLACLQYYKIYRYETKDFCRQISQSSNIPISSVRDICAIVKYASHTDSKEQQEKIMDGLLSMMDSHEFPPKKESTVAEIQIALANYYHKVTSLRAKIRLLYYAEAWLRAGGRVYAADRRSKHSFWGVQKRKVVQEIVSMDNNELKKFAEEIGREISWAVDWMTMGQRVNIAKRLIDMGPITTSRSHLGYYGYN